jgi:glycerate kinase
MHQTVRGPLGKPTPFYWLSADNGKTAIVEMAGASGIGLLEDAHRDVYTANTYGTGELIKDAALHGAKKIVLGLGGSATIDAGLGILQALGMQLLDAHGREIAHDSNALLQVERIAATYLNESVRKLEFVLLCDVDNPLLGKNGAARTFGPQKGASAEQVEKLESLLAKYNQLLTSMTGQNFAGMPGGGAAGGVALSLKAFFNTRLVSGVDYVLERLEVEQHMKEAQLAITAEGKLDRQTLSGKAPMGVARMCKKHGVPLIALCGMAEDVEALNDTFDAVFPISGGPATLAEALANTGEDLIRISTQIGRLYAAILKV